MSLTDLAGHLGISVPYVAYGAERRKVIATRNGY